MNQTILLLPMSERNVERILGELFETDPRVTQLRNRFHVESGKISELEQIQADRIFKESSAMRKHAALLRSGAAGNPSKLEEADKLEADRILIRDDATKQLAMIDETHKRLRVKYDADMVSLLKELGHAIDDPAEQSA